MPRFAAPHDTTLVSRATGGAKANGVSSDAALSGDGRYVAFWSTATNLSSADGDGMADLYRRDLSKDRTVLVSRASGANGQKAAAASFHGGPSISADGRLIAFLSDAANLSRDDRDGLSDFFVRDLDSDETTLVSRASGKTGANSDEDVFSPAISADGRYVAFSAAATNLTPEQPVREQVYVRDLQTQTTELVSRVTGAGGAPADRAARFPVISADGRYVAFTTAARNLSPDDRNGQFDGYVRDRLQATTTLVTRASGKGGAVGSGRSGATAISAAGRFVAFSSTAPLSPSDSDITSDVYVRDIAAHTTTLISRATGAIGAKADAPSHGAAISDDGGRVAFISDADNLSAADRVGVTDVYVRDTVANTTSLLSRASGATGSAGNDDSYDAAISADGRFVAFGSHATILSLADPDPDYDQYVRELPMPARSPFGGARAAAVRAPVRRWYRVSAEVTLHKSGDFAFESYTDHRETNITLRLRSRTAFILFHQCVPLATPGGLDAKDLSFVAGLARSAFSCVELKEKLRERGFSARDIRNLRLTDDVRFTANGEGFLDGFEQTINVPERPTTFLNGLPGICPAQTTVRVRVLGLPVAIGGLLKTASAARDGVLLRPELEIGVQSESGTLGAPCFVAGTGEQVGAPGRLVQRRTSLRLLADKPNPEPVRFKIGRRFGRSFTVTGAPITTEPLANGKWTTTSNVTLKFTPCPRGGRDVNGC